MSEDDEALDMLMPPEFRVLGVVGVKGTSCYSNPHLAGWEEIGDHRPIGCKTRRGGWRA